MNHFQAQLTFSDGETMSEKRFGENLAPTPVRVSIEEFERDMKRTKFTEPRYDSVYEKGMEQLNKETFGF